MFDVAPTHIRIRCDAYNAMLSQSLGCVHKHRLRFEDAVSDDRFHYIELKLSGLSSNRNGEIIRDDLEANLINDFRNHRIHFTGHNA